MRTIFFVSSGLSAIRWTTMGKSDLSQRTAYFLIPAFNPGFGRPVCSRNPPGYSIDCGLAAGRRGRRENGFVTNAPNESNGIPVRESGANPNDPAAFMSGLLKYKSRFINYAYVIARSAPAFCDEAISNNEEIASGYRPRNDIFC